MIHNAGIKYYIVYCNRRRVYEIFKRSDGNKFAEQYKRKDETL